MINLRYHIISLIAVFLALGLGILMGTTVIDQGLVHDLRRRTDGLDKSLDGERAANDALRRQQDLWETFGRDTFTRFSRGKLAKRSIVLLVQDEQAAGMVDSITQALTGAGAVVEGRINLTKKWELKDPAARQQLALALGASGDGDLVGEAAGRLAGRLGQSRDISNEPDLFASLRDAGFLSFETSVENFPSAGALVIVVPSGAKAAQPPQNQFFLPLLKSLVPARQTAVVEPNAAEDSLADRVRGDGDLRSEVATVDDGDIALGRLALVFALRSLFTTQTATHFGARRSAASLVPASFGP
jgi:hypothetical protein